MSGYFRGLKKELYKNSISLKTYFTHSCSSLWGWRVASLAAAPWQFLFGQIEHGLNAAAEVHQTKRHIMDVASKHIWREVVLEREQSHRREVVEHDDGEDDEDHLERSLLHGVHLVPTGPGLPEHPEDRNVAEDHEDERCKDHPCEDFLKVHNVAHTFGRSVGQSDQPDDQSQDCSMLAVFEFGEGDGVNHSHVTIQADAGEEKRRGVLDAVEEAQDVPDDAVVEEDDVGQLEGWDQAEEDVEDRQVEDEDV